LKLQYEGIPDKHDLKPFISGQKIKKCVSRLAGKISKDYKKKVPVLIGVLNGSFVFMSDLIRELAIDSEVDFIRLSSYGNSKVSSRQVKLLKDISSSIKDRDVLVVEDIVDSGLTLKFIKDLILSYQPSSLEFVTLLFKKNVSELDFNVKYIGFKIKNKFVVGYGIDYAGKYRNLKEIYFLKN